jgi:hypothetical protein
MAMALTAMATVGGKWNSLSGNSGPTEIGSAVFAFRKNNGAW